MNGAVTTTEPTYYFVIDGTAVPPVDGHEGFGIARMPAPGPTPAHAAHYGHQHLMSEVWQRFGCTVWVEDAEGNRY